jgi:glycerol-3-phosphate acyltransferase PlsX
MGCVLATARWDIATPRVGLLSIGEEETKGNALVKETHGLLAGGVLKGLGTFIGNVEGRDVMTTDVDVVVTDGFTGNVTLKTIEGAMRFVTGAVLGAVSGVEGGDALISALAPLANELDPDTHGGAVLLGVNGVCIISHGSSSARAIVNAVRVGRDAVASDLVAKLANATAAHPV